MEARRGREEEKEEEIGRKTKREEEGNRSII
jgi:hypothetical protein